IPDPTGAFSYEHPHLPCGMVRTRLGIDPFAGCISKGYVLRFSEGCRTVVLLLWHTLFDSSHAAPFYYLMRQTIVAGPADRGNATCTSCHGNGPHIDAGANTVLRCTAKRHNEYHQFSHPCPVGHRVGEYYQTAAKRQTN